MSNDDDTLGDIPSGEAFEQALRGLLRPLVRAMIAEGVTAPALYRQIKRIYVDEAEAHFAIDGARPTDSRVSMLTGVHRRDVKSFRESNGDGRETQRKVSALATLLARWRASSETTDADGRPVALLRVSDDGPSFDSLAASVSKDIRPRTMLDELTRQGLVTVEDDWVRIAEDAVVGPADQAQKIHFFAENVGDHIAAAVDNLLSEEPRFIERAVFYNRLSATSVDAIEAEARAEGAALLDRLNAEALARQTDDLDNEAATERFRFGVFFYREDEDAGEAGKKAGDDHDGQD